ncbi:SMI1/KNR4 family protein [Shewanella corallii]|uniref:SMI1/KNR4 family protein n=1 Tax=Shewanella corallii TaxID=560080 RepID=A0ABT0NCX8_9GAMM|nr:SMI1/KNR4 family protein [Shewanella corallii]MCL2915637.1 SMI1/KNR4 family protein [Shewanella corallii]
MWVGKGDTGELNFTALMAQLVAADPDWQCSGPQPMEKINEVAAQFDLNLPDSYISFLNQLGCVDYLDCHYAGLDEDYLDPEYGFMWPTHVLREESDLPHHLLCIEYDHDAHQLPCIDLSMLVDGECRLVWFDIHRRAIVGHCADSFAGYFFQRVSPWLDKG